MRSVRIKFSKTDSAKYISHLDLTRCLTRAFRRTDIPLWYTEGFNPHPYLVFGLSLPLGVEGLNETLDIRLTDDDYPDEKVLSELNRATVPGIEFKSISVPVEKPFAIVYGEYNLTVPNVEDPDDLKKKITDTIDSGEVLIEKKCKKGPPKIINVCEHIKDFDIEAGKDFVKASFILPAGNDFTVNPVLFCKSLFEKAGEQDLLYRIVRLNLLTADGKEFK